MEGTADDRYFEWLYSHIGSVDDKNPRHTFWELAKQMYQKRFFWFVPNDDNRAMDGKLLRESFINDMGGEGVSQSWMDLPCSFLEMLIALSAHTAFETYGEAGDWFWKILENLGLNRFSDSRYNPHVAHEIDECMERVMRREYGADGTGGLFPLRHAQRDQRNVEIWYQKEAYLIEGLRVNNGPRV